jgi:ATP-dependent RNA helicase DDX52/ROK1
MVSRKRNSTFQGSLLFSFPKQGLMRFSVRHLILDEADKLLESGFLEQVDEILAACSSPTLRSSMFSATMPQTVEELVKTVMRDPVRVFIGRRNAATETITQKLEYVGTEQGKKVAIRNLISGNLKPPVLIFVETIEKAKKVFKQVAFNGIKADLIHSERTQSEV